MLIAVDTGGTKTLVAAFTNRGSLSRTTKFPTPKNQGEYIETLVEAIREVTKSEEIDAIIVALPGRVEPNGVLALARNIGWEDFDVKKALKKTFSVPILVENDANLAGLAESKLHKDPRVCLYVTVSTGIGTGIITDGKINPYFAQSEGGQMVVEHDGGLKRWENFASGNAIRLAYGKLAKDINSKHAWRKIAKNISVGLLAITPVARPDMIIIGGSIGTYFDRYEEYLVGYLKEQLHYVPPIVAASHPEEAVIYGCYYYAVDQLAAH